MIAVLWYYLMPNCIGVGIGCCSTLKNIIGCVLKFHNFLISCNAVSNFIPSLPFKQQTNTDMWIYVG